MPTFFSINDGDFSSGLATVVGDVSAVGTSGFVLTTTYSYPTTTPTVADSIYGVAFQLSAVSGSPTGTVDIILSASNGSSTTASFPVNGLTQKSGLNAITPTNPVGWQVFAFDTPVSFPTGNTMRVGVKTSAANKVSLIGQALTNLNRSYVTSTLGNPAAGAGDIIHIVGTLSSTGLITRTVNYNVTTPTTYGNFYVHNGGVLNFDPTINIDLTLAGAQGLQITPDGTVNIGSSVNPVQADKTHKINLSNSFINVHNGATFNVYGAYKTPYALISSPVAAGSRTYPLTTDVSNWIFNSTVAANGDSVVITPNLTAFGTSEITTLSARSSNNIITWNTASFSHVSSNYIPSIVNMTRNVQLSGNNTYVRFLDGSVSNLNNIQFRGLRNTNYKGLQFCTNSTGSVSLSNCAFNGDGVATMPAFSFDVAKTPTSNVSIKGSNFSGYGATTDIIKLEAVSANNLSLTDNIVLNASQNGMLIDRLSSTYVDIKNNFLIGSSQNGLRVTNPYVLGGTIGGIGCLNQRCGSVVAGTSGRANYDGLAGHYNTLEGVNILGTLPQLSSTVFSNITANNNRTTGFELSANSNNLNSPIRVNVNGLISNNNLGLGFEAYAITGNLSSLSFNDNLSGNMYISVGNGGTTFDGVTSVNTASVSSQTSNIHILSGLNYGSTIFKNSYLLGNRVNALKLNNTKFEQFYVENSTLSSTLEDIGSSSNLNLLEGSYHFNNCTFGTGILSTTVQNYQPEVFLENGFVVMKENGVANKHYKLLRSGKISLDTTLAYGTNTVSEKLEPTSTTIKLRCGSKMIPVNKNDSYTVGVYVRKSSSYSGDAPRLMLKRNPALGYDDDILATSVGANDNWELLSGVVPAALDQGIFEVYVDCSGAAGSGAVNIDNWSLTLN